MLTVQEIAAAIAAATTTHDIPTEEEVTRARSRIRVWTINGALNCMTGGRGKGQNRFYRPDTVYLAAVLHALAGAGIPAPRFPKIARQIELDQLWPRAIAGEDLILSADVAETQTQVVISKLPRPPSMLATIAIDLGELFARLKAPVDA